MRRNNLGYTFLEYTDLIRGRFLRITGLSIAPFFSDSDFEGRFNVNMEPAVALYDAVVNAPETVRQSLTLNFAGEPGPDNINDRFSTLRDEDVDESNLPTTPPMHRLHDRRAGNEGNEHRLHDRRAFDDEDRFNADFEGHR